MAAASLVQGIAVAVAMATAAASQAAPLAQTAQSAPVPTVATPPARPDAAAAADSAAADAAIAIVTQDQTALRAAPRDAAAQQAVLWAGDVLEVRGERLGYLQVYDHRRERAGYVRATQVRTTALTPQDAPGLLAVVRFLRDTPGAEALGIGYVAAYLKAAPAEAITAEPFDALGSMAERLARRASVRQAKGSDAVAAHLEVATGYGVRFVGIERDGTAQLCADGEAFGRVFALGGTADQRARAALALTRPDCIDPALPPLQRQAHDQWRAELLDRIDALQFAQLAGPVKNRLRLRRAGVWASLAFAHARRGDDARPLAAQAAARALTELAAVDKTQLTDADQADDTEAALRVGAVRWAAVPPRPTTAGLRIVTQPGEPGQTCVSLVDGPAAAAVLRPAPQPGGAPAQQPVRLMRTAVPVPPTTATAAKAAAAVPASAGEAAAAAPKPLLTRCTYGTVWTASASASPNGKALALAVQPLDGWRELWVFQRQASGWTVDVLPPADSGPGLGAIEFAGWVPGGERLLVAREARLPATPTTPAGDRRSFEVLRLPTLHTEQRASRPGGLAVFARWQDPAWTRGTVSVR